MEDTATFMRWKEKAASPKCIWSLSTLCDILTHSATSLTFPLLFSIFVQIIIVWCHWLQSWFVFNATSYLSNSSKLTYWSHTVRILKKYLSPDSVLTTAYTHSSAILLLFQPNMAYITTLLFLYSLPPPSRRVQSIYCCFILSQTHPIYHPCFPSSAQYPPLQLLTLARQSIPCKELC